MSGRSATLAAKLREAPRLNLHLSYGFKLALAIGALWYRRSRERRQLAKFVNMPGCGFYRDTMFTSSDVYEEINKPFWKP